MSHSGENADFRDQNSHPHFKTAVQLLYWEGAFAMVFDAWVGPTYLSGLAGELGVSVLCVSLITSAAWIGAVGQLVGAWAYERVPSYKQYTVGVAAASRGVWLLPLFFAGLFAYHSQRDGTPFPTERWFAITAGIACLGALFGASSAGAWNSWMRALVPEAVRGRFFGARQRYVMAALMGANLLASTCIDWRPHGYRAGYALLGGLAIVAATLSTFLLSRVRDAGEPRADAVRTRLRFSRAKVQARLISVLRQPQSIRLPFFSRIVAPLRNRRFRNVVIFGAAMNGVMQLAGPYFPYYFTKELHIPMSQVAFWLVLSNIGCLCAAGYWGRKLDRTGDARPTLRFTSILISISPLFYLTPAVHWIRLIAPVDYLTNGMIWVGYQLALTTLLFKAIPSERPAFCFSIYTAAAGLTGAAGSLLGGRLASLLLPWGGFRALWLLAGLLRLAVVFGLFNFLYEEKEKINSPGELLADFS
jgi:MFS family permease